MSTRDRWRVVLAWGPIAAWSGVVWLLGGDAWSAPQTSRILGPLIEWLLPGLDALARDEIVQALRKLAHPAVYGLLALLSLRAVALGTSLRRLGVAMAALAWVAALATADEARQAGSGVRTGAAGDVLLDLGGGAAVIMLCMGLEYALGRPLFGPREVLQPGASSGPNEL